MSVTQNRELLRNGGLFLRVLNFVEKNRNKPSELIGAAGHAFGHAHRGPVELVSVCLMIIINVREIFMTAEAAAPKENYPLYGR